MQAKAFMMGVCVGGIDVCVNIETDSIGNKLVDQQGKMCSDYPLSRRARCSGGWDDSDFSASDMCCVCGGGDGPKCLLDCGLRDPLRRLRVSE